MTDKIKQSPNVDSLRTTDRRNLPAILSVTWDDQNPADLLRLVGEWLEAYDHKEQAIRYYESSLLVDPNSSLSAWRASQIAIRSHQYAYAAEKIEQSLRTVPDHAPSHYVASLAYWGLKQPARALTYANSTLQYDPIHSGAFLQKLRCLIALEEWQQVEDIYGHLPPSLTASGEVHLWMALACMHLNKIQDAIMHYAKVPVKVRNRFLQQSKELETQILT